MTGMAELVLVRPGQTRWSRDGRHTGRTDLPLTADGEAEATALAARLTRQFALVLSSPLQRARRTAELAGLTGEVDADLVEWDYGAQEGRTTEQARERWPGWSVWDDTGLGESLADLAARQQRVLDRVRPVLAADQDVCLVGHGHALRVLAACWLGLGPHLGQQLVLGAGSVSTLGFEHGYPAVLTWNG